MSCIFLNSRTLIVTLSFFTIVATSNSNICFLENGYCCFDGREGQKTVLIYGYYPVIDKPVICENRACLCTSTHTLKFVFVFIMLYTTNILIFLLMYFPHTLRFVFVFIMLYTSKIFYLLSKLFLLIFITYSVADSGSVRIDYP